MRMNKLVYCITTKTKWALAQKQGEYVDESLETQGFIHCTYPHQLLGVANKHFKGVENLLILCIDPIQLTSHFVDENPSNLQDLYPHIYGVINLDAVVDVYHFQTKLDGALCLPEKLDS